MGGKQDASPLYRAIKGIVRLCYPKMKVIGAENLPAEPAIIVGNHAKMHGPIACELYFPNKSYTWCAGEMMHAKEVTAYTYKDFWSRKPKCIRWFYKLLSYIIAPLSVCVFNNANTIGVYHDARAISTFRNTVKRLQEGASVVIFPEHDKEYNHILCDFQDRFIDVAAMFQHSAGRALDFVPMYIAPALKAIYIGKPIRFSADAPIKEERQRIREYLMETITHMAESLPRHTVIPYRNIGKKYYPLNISNGAEE